MQDINQRKSTDQYGEDISNVEKSLRQVGIQLRDTKDSFKPMSQVLDETAKKWNTLTQLQQSDVAKSIAGVRQRENFIVLMNHYNDSLKLQGQMTDSSGSAMTRYGEYAKSTEAKLNDLTNAFQKLSMQLIHSETINSAISGLTNFVTGVGRVTSSIGGLNTALLIVIPIISIKFLSSLYSAAAGAGILETATVALSLGVKGLSASLLALASNPVTWLIVGITAITTLIPIWINHQQELKQQTEETTKAQKDLNTALDGFNSGLDTTKITAATTAIESLKSAIKFDDKVKQIQALENEIDNLTSKASNDKSKGMQTGDLTAYSQDIALLGQKKDKLVELQGQLGTVTEATTQYNNAVIDAVDKTKTQLGTYDTILKQVADGHKFTADEANKLIATDSNLSQAFSINGDAATVNADAIKNLKGSAIDQAITAVNSSISQTKTIINNSIDRTNAYVLEANSLNSLADMWNAINSVTNGYGNANDAGINSGSIAQIQKNYKPLMDLYSTLDDLNKLKGSVSGYVDTGGGFTSTPSGSSSSSPTSSVAQQVSIEDSLIKSFNTQVEITQQQEKILNKQLATAKSAKDYNSELTITNDLIKNQQLQISQFGDAKAKIQAEFDKVSADSQLSDIPNWMDEQGNATLAYQTEWNAGSVANQKEMTATFDKLSKLQKAFYDNANSVDTLTQSITTFSTSLNQLGIDKYNDSITDIDQRISTSKSTMDLYNSSSKEYTDEQKSQIILLKQKQVTIDDETASLKKQLEATDLTAESRKLLNDELAQNKIASNTNQKAIAEFDPALKSITQQYDLQQKENSELQKSLDLQLQIQEAVQPKNYDMISVILQSQISAQQTNLSQIQSSLDSTIKLRDATALNSAEWETLNTQVSTYQTNLDSALSTLSSTYKSLETNSINQQLTSAELTIFGGQTETQAKQALQNKIDYQSEFISGAEKAAAILRIQNQLAQDNASLNNGVIDGQQTLLQFSQAQLDILNSSSDIKRSDLDLMEKQLAIQKTQAELANSQNEKSIRQLTQNSDGSYEWVWVSDQTKTLQLQGTLYQEQQDLAKTQLDDQNKQDQLLLNQKSTYLSNIKTVIQNALNGEYSTTTAFNNAMTSANTGFLSSMQGSSASTWASISSNTQSNLNNMLSAYQNYVNQMSVLQAQANAIAASKSTTPVTASTSGGTTSSGVGTVIGTSTGPNGSHLTTITTATGTSTVLAGTNGTKAWANGTEDSDEGFAITSEKGAELTYLNKGSAVIPADFTKNIMAFGANPINYMQNLIGNIKMPTSISKVATNTGVSNSGITIQSMIVQAQNVNDFVSQLDNLTKLTNVQFSN